MGLADRMDRLGRSVAEREAGFSQALDAARHTADLLHRTVRDALDAFHAALREAGAGHLQIELTPPRVDDKHVHAVEFDLRRGRTRAIVTVKSKGEVTLVGPFAAGKNEGPCKSVPWDEEEALERALGDFLERFLEAATAP